MRDHYMTLLTDAELEHAYRELAASLALAQPGPPIRAPILARISSIDTEAARCTTHAPQLHQRTHD